MDIIYIIPSYKRADKQSTLSYLEKMGVQHDRIIISLQSESDYEKYSKRYESRAEILYRPGGNKSINLNNTLSIIPNGQKIMILDDDIKSVMRMNGKKELLEVDSPDAWEEFVSTGYEAAEGLRTIGFSVYPVCNAFFMSETIAPASLGEGTLIGLTKVPGLSFDKNLPVKEDYDLSCRIIRRYGAYPRLNMYSCNAPHYTKGGCEEWWNDKRLNIRVARTLAHRYPEFVTVRKSNPEEIQFKIKG